MRSTQQVIVVDADSRFLEYVNPAIARKLIEAGLASKYSYDPFIVRLGRDASTKYMQIRSISALIKWH
jgi:hypothetical protein